MSDKLFYWGRFIAYERKQQSISQRGLAVKAGVCRSTVRCIEKDKSKGNIYTIEKLLACLGYELDAVLPDIKNH